ncbi:MAG: DUF6850 family outer membrane beta-barrel protein [Barnesiella sp.]
MRLDSIIISIRHGDTIGGDLQTEQYRFSGGYSGKEDYSHGATGAYRAKIEYRDRDPRPKT